MNKLYYGSGCCSLQGDIIALEIRYTGKIHITDKAPESYQIVANDYKIMVIPIGEEMVLTDLFDYVGELKVKSAIGVKSEKKAVNIILYKQIHHPEYMESNAEDMTLLSEEMKSSYVYKHRVNKTKVDNNVIKNQWSNAELYFKNGKS